MPEAQTAGASKQGRVGAIDWVGQHLIEIAFAVVVIGAAAYLLDRSSSAWFLSDEWLYADQGRQERKLLDPYNGHLSVTTILTYRVLLELFGFESYAPFLVVGVLVVLAVPVGMFLLFRARVGAPLAALAGVVMLWHPGIQPLAILMNHVLVMIGAIACAWGLVRKGRGPDLWVAGGLAFALMSAGSGLAVAAAAVVHSLMTRATRRRWIAVLVPSLLWSLWWLIYLRTLGTGAGTLSADALETIDLMWDGTLGSFNDLALGSQVVGALLAIAFVAHLLWRLRQGLAAAANSGAWTIALIVDWFGLTRARGQFLDVHAYRYQLVAGGFVLLALLPPERVEWPRIASWRPAAAVAAATILAGALMGVAVSDDLRRSDRQQAQLSAIAQVHVALATLDEARVPDDFAYGLNLGGLTARQIRRLTGAFGEPGPSSPDAVDQKIVENLHLRPEATAFPAPATCRPARAVVDVEAGPRVRAFISARSADPAHVAIRRFGDKWIEVGQIDPGTIHRLALPDLASPVRWQIRGEGLCAVNVA